MPPNTDGFTNLMANQRPSSIVIEVETDPSIAAADDLGTIQYLAQIDKLHEDESRKEEMGMVVLRVNAHLDKKKPCELPKCFVRKGPTIPWNKVSNPSPLEHRHGTWSAVRDSFFTISDCDSVTTNGGAGLYIGAKKSLEFILEDGTKTGWLMIEYYLLREIKDANCELHLLRDKVVLCKLFNLERSGHAHIKNTAGEVTNQASHDHDPAPIASIEEPAAEGSCDIFGGLTPIIDLPTELEVENQGRSRHICSRRGCYKKRSFLEGDEERQPTKRSRQGSPVWEYYTKIVKPGDDKVVFAACKICNKVLSAHPKKDGTTNLLGHIEACIVKHLMRYSVMQASRNPMDTGQAEAQAIGGVAPEDSQPAGLNTDSPCLGEPFWSNLKRVEAYLLGD